MFLPKRTSVQIGPDLVEMAAGKEARIPLEEKQLSGVIATLFVLLSPLGRSEHTLWVVCRLRGDEGRGRVAFQTFGEWS